MSPGSKRSGWRRYVLDWKAWLGLGIPVAAFAYTLRDVDLADVATDIRGAHVGLILAMVPVQLFLVWLRSFRWSFFTRSLADPAPSMAAHLRATLVGTFALNVLPFRIGELARPWALARETNVGTSAALGTVLLERAIDFTTLSLLGGAMVLFQTKAMPAWVRTGALALAAVSALPFSLLIALRVSRDNALRLIARLLRVFPERIRDPAAELVLEVCRGLESLRGGRSVAKVALLSLLIWCVVIPLPFALGLLAFDVSLTPSQFVLAVLTVHVFTALAVAAPAAPGFFGVYHFACREALSLFGVSASVAVGYGTIVHLTFWLPATLVGGLAVVQIGARIRDLAEPPLSKAAPEAHR